MAKKAAQKRPSRGGRRPGAGRPKVGFEIKKGYKIHLEPMVHETTVELIGPRNFSSLVQRLLEKWQESAEARKLLDNLRVRNRKGRKSRKRG